jgi:hypothetical protein
MSSQPKLRKARRFREIQRERSRKGVAARERERRDRAVACGGWARVRSVLLVIHAAPDGRSIALRYSDGAGEWMRCGSVRAVRGALARLIWAGRVDGLDRIGVSSRGG